MDDQKKIGFIGLGVMGEPICRHIRTKANCTVVGFDQVPDALKRLSAYGVTASPSVAALANEVDIVFLCLPSGEVFAEVARGNDGLLAAARPGQIIVDLGTSGVGITREMAKDFAPRGVRFADAPVMRTRAAAEAGTLACTVGADPEIFEQVRPLIATFATDITHCGGIGCGAIAKIVNQMVLFQNVLALCEAYTVARAAGMDPKLLFGALSKGSADSFALRNHGMKAIVPGEFPTRAFSVQYAKKDLTYALQLAADLGVDVSGTRSVNAWFDQAIQAGDGDRYFPVISRLMSTVPTSK